jgi:hypothetical protein
MANTYLNVYVRGARAIFGLLISLPMALFTLPIATSPALGLVGPIRPAVTTVGDPTVDESAGSLALTVELDLPPGPAGFEPGVALRYSTGVEEGPLGLGWELSALPDVRCAVRFGSDACRRLELGGHLLVGPDTSGDLHTFVESFTRVRPAVGSSRYVATLPNGVTQEYGKTANARVIALDGSVRRWLLSEQVDPHGNVISYTYDRADEGSPLLEEISYASGTRRVEFLYEVRPNAEVHVSFSGGIRSALSRRLNEIRVFAGGQLYGRYALG